MSLIDLHLARRIDRLARRVHAPYRFAHHPLCEAYAGEIIRVWGWRICKGCTLTLVGVCLGLVTAVLLPLARLAFSVKFGSLVVVAIALTLWRTPHRLGKGLTRMVPALLAVVTVVSIWQSHPKARYLIAAISAAGLFCLWHSYRRRGPWRDACLQCPELAFSPCAGFRLQVRRERAFSRLVGRLLREPPNADV